MSGYFKLVGKGRRLAQEGRSHLTYVNQMQDKEYEIPDDTPEREIDDRLFDAMLADLAEHKKTCEGCTVVTEEMKERAEKIARKFGLKPHG